MLIANYNVSIIKEESDENFINKLIELKKLIKNKVLHSNTKCGRDITHFKESNIEKRAKELAEKQKQEQEAAEAAKKQQEAEAAKKQQEAEAEAAQERERERERRLSRSENEITPVQPQRQALKSLVHGPSEESGAHRQQALAEGLTWEDAQSNEIDEQLHVTKNVWEISPGGKEGIMVSMKNAISGFMNEVEPAPILGVSGGMEEEEELTIESPVLSMDNLQEDLQDMTIFMKELLDQVQLIYLIGLNWNNILFRQSV
ncbi:hypothetical protein PVBG_05578 [Plasmodium vivax Brazil I]|uniref:Uncharacterized protein n=1 Tax=Plasmodium vivax (strain Brazil I) TaxID=1033975 RepID=A0A0J9SLB1_PLAV1|nr:hypothetical protein PVBG_05578 [Plasmodium vivax Brazil I]